MDTDRIFDLLQEHTVLLTRIGTRQETSEERMDRLIPVVAEHSKQLGYAKGAAAILAMLWTGVVAIFAALIKGHH